MSTLPMARDVLSDDLLERIRSRAADHDRTNTFPNEDLTELKAAGYLQALVPQSFGGQGMTLAELAKAQMRLAAAAPATALSINMHHVWLGVAKFVHARGEDTTDFIFTDTMAGEVYAFGVSEPGNDLVLFGSNSDARPDGEGGYTFYGTKIFTSASPVWTKLGTFGTDATEPDDPHSVWGFVDRQSPGIDIKDDWDALGMRASQSSTTVLDGAYAPAERIVRRIPPGPTMDSFVFGIFATFEILLASVYTGIAERAITLATEAAKRRRSTAKGGAPLSDDPDIRWRVANAAIQLDAIYPQIELVAADIDADTDRGELWMPQLSAVKVRATETAKDVVEQAIRVAGGSSYFNRNELSRLYRDVLAGIFHPSDDESLHSAWANAVLGPISE